MQADPDERWRAGGRQRRPAVNLESAAEGCRVRAPFVVEDEDGRPLLEVAAHARANGETTARLRIFSQSGETGVTLYAAASGGVLGVHSPGSEKAALVAHADSHGGMLILRTHDGQTEVELPADIQLLKEGAGSTDGATRKPWWRFW